MLKVRPLELPKVRPSTDAIRSRGHSETAYDPESWEFQYFIYRYLQNVDDVALIARHESIVRNMTVIYADDRHVIPVQDFLSTWYWFRKEHQTRLEMFLRGITQTVRIDRLVPMMFEAPARPRWPNCGDVLFRFSETRFLAPMLRGGHVWLNCALTYLDPSLGVARADNELRKTRVLVGSHSRITTADGRAIPVVGDVHEHVEMPNYYILSTSCDYRPLFFDAFRGSDACLVIHDPDSFAERMEGALRAALPGWYFHHNPVRYFDPHEPASKDEHIDPIMSKDFSFAYEMEYRFICFSRAGVSATGHIELELGSLHDVAGLFPRPTVMGSAT